MKSNGTNKQKRETIQLKRNLLYGNQGLSEENTSLTQAHLLSLPLEAAKYLFGCVRVHVCVRVCACVRASSPST